MALGVSLSSPRLRMKKSKDKSSVTSPPGKSPGEEDNQGCIIVLLPEQGSLSLYSDPGTSVHTVLKAHPGHALTAFSDPRHPDRGMHLPGSETLLLGCTYQLVKDRPLLFQRRTIEHLPCTPQHGDGSSALQPWGPQSPRSLPPRRLLRSSTQQSERAFLSNSRAVPSGHVSAHRALLHRLPRSFSQQPERLTPPCYSQCDEDSAPITSRSSAQWLLRSKSQQLEQSQLPALPLPSRAPRGAESNADHVVRSLPADSALTPRLEEEAAWVATEPWSDCAVVDNVGSASSGKPKNQLSIKLPQNGMTLLPPCPTEAGSETFCGVPPESPAQHRRAMLTLGGCVPSPSAQ